MDKLLHTILNTQSESYKTERMQQTIIRILNAHNIDYSRQQNGNIYATKGNASLYPTMVCHIDTVHDINDNAVVCQLDDNLFAMDKETMLPHGIGGDDKVGIYITIMCLLHFDNFKAAFFVDEEVGCIGSRNAKMRFFDDSTIILQCDRQGYHDFVTEISNVTLCNDDLLNDIQPTLQEFARKTCNGGMTDVQQIAKATNIQCANMSCGYYMPHTDNEYINLTDVQDTLDMCIQILSITQNKQYTIEDRIKPYTYSFPYYQQSYYYQEPIDNTYKQPNETGTCPTCQCITEYDEIVMDHFCNHCNKYQSHEINSHYYGIE